MIDRSALRYLLPLGPAAIALAGFASVGPLTTLIYGPEVEAESAVSVLVRVYTGEPSAASLPRGVTPAGSRAVAVPGTGVSVDVAQHVSARGALEHYLTLLGGDDDGPAAIRVPVEQRS